MEFHHDVTNAFKNCALSSEEEDKSSQTFLNIYTRDINFEIFREKGESSVRTRAGLMVKGGWSQFSVFDAIPHEG